MVATSSTKKDLNKLANHVEIKFLLKTVFNSIRKFPVPFWSALVSLVAVFSVVTQR